MISNSTDGCAIAWSALGSGPAVLLIHGFASTARRNWIETGWTEAIARAGHRALLYDQRGHGDSDKRYRPEDYSPDRLADDAVAVLDAAEAARAVVMGYSMGARVALEVALTSAERVSGLVLSGIGARFRDLGGASDDGERDVAAAALEADDPSGFPEAALAYRRFADQTGQDRRALAACWRRPIRVITADDLSRVAAPTLVVVGDRDDVAGDAAPLARGIRGATLVRLAGKNHMSAVGARGHRAAVLELLARLRPA